MVFQFFFMLKPVLILKYRLKPMKTNSYFSGLFDLLVLIGGQQGGGGVGTTVTDSSKNLLFLASLLRTFNIVKRKKDIYETIIS